MGWMVESALQVFARLRLQGLQPAMIAYITVVCTGDKWNGSVGLANFFVLLRMQGLQPKMVTYTAVVGACKKG